MRSAFIALALLASTPVFAADTAPAAQAEVKTGAMLRDSNNYRLGAISRVNADGSVGLIIDSRFVTIPADTLSVVDGKVVTRLTKREVIGLR